jgi:hypothetical protein
MVQIQQVFKGLLGSVLKAFLHLLLLSSLLVREFDLYMKQDHIFKTSEKAMLLISKQVIWRHQVLLDLDISWFLHKCSAYFPDQEEDHGLPRL